MGVALIGPRLVGVGRAGTTGAPRAAMTRHRVTELDVTIVSATSTGFVGQAGLRELGRVRAGVLVLPDGKTLCTALVDNYVAVADRLGRKRRRVPHSIDDLDQRLVYAEHVAAHRASRSHVPHLSQPVAVRRPTGRHIKGAPMAVTTSRSHGGRTVTPTRAIPAAPHGFLDARHQLYRQRMFRRVLPTARIISYRDDQNRSMKRDAVAACRLRASYLAVATATSVFSHNRVVETTYLTEKAARRSFTDEDQAAVVALAGFAGIAIERDRRQATPGPV